MATSASASLPKSIAVLGAGHVGAPHAIMLAKKCPDIRVTILDNDVRKIAAWNSSTLPFFEPSMIEAVEEVRGVNLFFSSNMTQAIIEADLILVSVSTPIKSDGIGANFAPDLQHWERMARLIAASTSKPKTIVERSTVPVKTADLMAAVLFANSGGQQWTVLSNPEFAREGTAMMDHAAPERVLIGAPPTEAGDAAAAMLSALYAKWVPRDKIIVAGLWSAELSKMTANAFLAQRISSINAISALCEKTGADIGEVAHAVGIDSRIGRKHLVASVGFGGACYDTHLRNLVYLCNHYRLKEVANYWHQVLKMNEWQKKRFAMQIVSAMFNTVSGKKLAMLGFAYKKNTSDVRNTPARDVCLTLLAERAQITISDPRVAKEAMMVALTGADGAEEHIHVNADPYLACEGAHAIVVMTEWDQFTTLDYGRIFESMEKPAFIFDGRNLLDHEALRALGFIVHGIGKPQPTRKPTTEEEALATQAALAEAARWRVGGAGMPTPPPEVLSTADGFGAIA
jgi:UDPglucose 6-dehydrogenase